MGRPEIYTLKYCLDEVRDILNVLQGDAEGIYVTWHDLIKYKSYSRQRISEWREKFKDDNEFSDTIKKIDEELENRLVTAGLKNKMNATIVIFSLKNNYGWKDKQETEHTGGIALHYDRQDSKL